MTLSVRILKPRRERRAVWRSTIHAIRNTINGPNGRHVKRQYPWVFYGPTMRNPRILNHPQAFVCDDATQVECEEGEGL